MDKELTTILRDFCALLCRGEAKSPEIMLAQARTLILNEDDDLSTHTVLEMVQERILRRALELVDWEEVAR